MVTWTVFLAVVLLLRLHTGVGIRHRRAVHGMEDKEPAATQQRQRSSTDGDWRTDILSWLWASVDCDAVPDDVVASSHLGSSVVTGVYYINMLVYVSDAVVWRS